MIKKIELFNFQSHKHTTLNFKAGVNVIIGPSDSGKTAILRALKWLITNRPLGEAFRSNWGGETLVALSLENCYIERGRGDDDNFYHAKFLQSGKWQQIDFKALGTEVPEEIINLLNISKVNFQSQMDSPFLLSESPGEVSRYLNKVAHIDQIDSSLKNIESLIRKISTNKKASKKEIERYEDELTDFDFLDKMEIDIEMLEKVQNDRDKALNKYNKIEIIKNKIEEIELLIKEYSKLLPAKKEVDQLIGLQNKKGELTKEVNGLYDLHYKLVDTNEKIDELKFFVSEKNLIKFLLNLYNNKREHEQKKNKLSKQITKIKDMHKSEKFIENKLQNLKNKWEDEAPEICPLCGSLLNGEHNHENS